MVSTGILAIQSNRVETAGLSWSDVLNKTNQGKQTLMELTSALVHTKELFRQSATTRVIMEKLRDKENKN